MRGAKTIILSAAPHLRGPAPRGGASNPIQVKLQPDRAEGVNVITAFEGGRVGVNARPYERSLIVPWQGAILDWNCERFADLDAPHFERLLELAPELVIFGSGASLRFPAAALWRSLIARHIGFEAMDTAAACRTYNVLAAEGRIVVAALLIEPPA